MPKPRSCPNCNNRIGISSGFSFDKDLNLICKRCGKKAYSTEEEKTTTYNYAANQSQGYGSHAHGGVRIHDEEGGHMSDYPNYMGMGRGDMCG